MKKLFISMLLVCFLSAPSWAITWINGTPQTLAWDAVTTLADDTPVPSTDIIQYEVFRVDTRTGDKANPESLGIVQTPTMTITFPEGRWVLAVQSRRLVPDGSGGHELMATSDLAWSDVPINCLNGEDFAIRVFKKPKGVQNMRIQ